VKAIESGAHRCQLRSIADSHGGNDEQVGGAVGENSSRARERATVRERERTRQDHVHAIAIAIGPFSKHAREGGSRLIQ